MQIKVTQYFSFTKISEIKKNLNKSGVKQNRQFQVLLMVYIHRIFLEGIVLSVSEYPNFILVDWAITHLENNCIFLNIYLL